jgi:glycerate kinase
MKTILLAPDSFKGSLSALQACEWMQRGAHAALASTCALSFRPVPLADGGEGTLEAVAHTLESGARAVHVEPVMVAGPLGAPVQARWARIGEDTALIEMAQASGLTLVPEHCRDALRATSAGTGQLITAALDAGCRRLIIGVGGSATTDGGSGALSALGARFLDAQGAELGPGGASLASLERIDLSGLDPRLRSCEVQVLCDVGNPLCGEAGAAHVYGPQKGASPEDVQVLDAALGRLADVAARELGCDRRNEAGAGAAGGVGFGLTSFLNARLASGIERVLDLADFDVHLRDASLVLTGEGALDAQTLEGKTIAGVCRRAQVLGVPVVAFGGAMKLSGAQMDELGLKSAFAIADGPRSLDECVENAGPLLQGAVERALRLL